ncbi:MAG TPA: thioredoxin family protein [Steroidobacteraceae bacterium]|nr:thioredoxin family protein [Steroidobacteraceae bacterium]
MKRSSWLGLVSCIIALTSFAAQAASSGYDPDADPFDQYQGAIAQAQHEGKLVLIIAGGDWCGWCKALNTFITSNSDIDAELHQAFVVMKVYVGPDNYNADFFDQLPPARGAPHFWIVSPERQVLSSESTTQFERGRKGYDRQEFLDFIARWKRQALALNERRRDENRSGG